MLSARVFTAARFGRSVRDLPKVACAVRLVPVQVVGNNEGTKGGDRVASLLLSDSCRLSATAVGVAASLGHVAHESGRERVLDALAAAPHRAAVSTSSSNASLTTSAPPDARTAARAAATSRCGSACMCSTAACCGPSTEPMRSHGLSALSSIATAHSRTARIRSRTRRAVDGLRARSA